MDADRLNPRAGSARLPWLLCAALILLAGGLGWRLYAPSATGDPVALSLTALEKQDRLVVFSAALSPVVAADDVRAWGMLKSRQIAVIPARVDYSVDLSHLSAARFHWDAQAQKLTVTLPPITPGRPDLDEAHAQYLREGVLITGDAEAHLTHDNTLTAARLAAQQAANPVLLELARGAAKSALAANLSLPLRAAGASSATVVIRFDGEKDQP